jgi:hypothetical protein
MKLRVKFARNLYHRGNPNDLRCGWVIQQKVFLFWVRIDGYFHHTKESAERDITHILNGEHIYNDL